MTEDISWGASLGSQILAEISLLDARYIREQNQPVKTLKFQESPQAQNDKENWGSTLGSQLLAELSLLDGNPKKEIPSTLSPVSDQTSSAIKEKSLSSKNSQTCKEKPNSPHLSEVSQNRNVSPACASKNCEGKSSSFKEEPQTPAQSHSVPSLITKSSSRTSAQNSLMHNEKQVEVRRSARLRSSQNYSLVKTNLAKPVTNSQVATLMSDQESLGKASPNYGPIPPEKLKLNYWGLPDTMIQKYEEKKITALFPWQVKCLETGNVLRGGNLIYSAPTSSGKTLVAEILMLRNILQHKKKAIYILPFVAVAKEKTRVLKEITEEVGIRVESFAGSSSPPGGFKVCDLAICTIEKANSLINRLIEDHNTQELGIVVVDELHLIGDSHRGYLIELLLTKILYASSKGSLPAQIVGMSATLPNLHLLAKWLRADLYVTDFRPIPLKEYVKAGTEVLRPDFQLVRQLDAENFVPNDIEHIIQLTLETILNGHSVLIFCPTKIWCEKMAQHVSSEYFNLGSNPQSVQGARLRQQLNGQLLVQVLERLKATPAGLDPVLGQTVRFAVAFHHAGLTCEEREVIEASFRHGVLRVLIATSTLSSGVNLPARRVIIRTPIFHGSIIDYQVYKQMIGRAGRYGVDTDGESFLICQPQEKSQVARMFASAAPPLKSCLLVTNSQNSESIVTVSMKRAILEIIATGSASSIEDIQLYSSCTLLSVLHNVPQETIDACITWLVNNEFIRKQPLEVGGERLIPTQLGLGCLASSLSPDESLVLLNELKTARRGLILDSDLHLVYQITPTYVADQLSHLDWLHYLTLWEDLNESQKRVGEAVGVEDRFLIRAMKGTVAASAPRQVRQLAVHRRFYTALALHELMNEISLAAVANKYKLNKGTLQSLQQQTATFAGMVTVFCHRLGWNTLYVLMEHFQSRLMFGVQLELCDLMRLPSMTSQVARLLYDAGITNVAGIASTSHENIDALLKNACPFRTAEENKKFRGEDVDAWALVKEARRFVQLELGIEIDWNKKTNCISSQKSHSPAISQRKELLNRLSLNLKKLPSPNHHSSPVFSKQTPQNLSVKSNRRAINVTPDMFADNSMETSAQCSLLPSPESRRESTRGSQTPLTKAVESLRLDESEGSLRTPQFAACAENLAPVTAKTNLMKRRATTHLEATPRSSNDSITALVSKKAKLRQDEKNTDKVFEDPSILSSSVSSTDESCLIPSSIPISTLTVTEAKTNSKIAMLINKSLKQRIVALNFYKERNIIMGIAISWAADEVHYLFLRETFDSSIDQSKTSKLKSWFQSLGKSHVEVVIYDIRQVSIDIRDVCQCSVDEIFFRDVDICNWVLEPTNTSVTISKLSKLHGSQVSPSKSLRGRQKTINECASLLEIYNNLKKRLMNEQLYKSFVETEMPVAMKMLEMESYGIAFDRSKCEEAVNVLRQHMKKLEESAHEIVGRAFSLTSVKDCAKIMARLNIEEKTPLSYINPLKKKLPLPSVKKASLVKLGKIHPLPRTIVEYRKIHAIVQQIVCPLLQTPSFFINGEERIAGECEFRTVTGRINIVRPNLQHIPRPFTLSDSNEINLRTSFIASKGTSLISADYSQLELRILAHLSSDPGLCSILNTSDGDVFRTIASIWKRKSLEEVTSDERQQAKQICYGVVYGMGNKSLADHLEIDEDEAMIFAESFHQSYPHIQKFIDTTIRDCRSNGFIVTIHGRKRYLPAINSNNNALRTQAERQAVNTRIQGSAADLVKTALVLLNQTIKDNVLNFHLVHQIHDELLFEVPTASVAEAARLIRHCMETAIPMKIKLPVAIKIGPTWGSMKPYF